MPHTHVHRDFKCPECGQLVTCLSCLEIHTTDLPRGPGFPEARYPIQPTTAPVFKTTGTTNEFPTVESRSSQPLPIATPNYQQSLFA